MAGRRELKIWDAVGLETISARRLWTSYDYAHGKHILDAEPRVLAAPGPHRSSCTHPSHPLTRESRVACPARAGVRRPTAPFHPHPSPSHSCRCLLRTDSSTCAAGDGGEFVATALNRASSRDHNHQAAIPGLGGIRRETSRSRCLLIIRGWRASRWLWQFRRRLRRHASTWKEARIQAKLQPVVIHWFRRDIHGDLGIRPDHHVCRIH